MAYATQAEILSRLGLDAVEAAGPYSAANIALFIARSDAIVDEYDDGSSAAIKAAVSNDISKRMADSSMRNKDMRGSGSVTDPQGMTRSGTEPLEFITKEEKRRLRGANLPSFYKRTPLIGTNDSNEDWDSG